MRIAFTHMDLLGQAAWQTLLAEQGTPALSLFMPVYPQHVKAHDEPLRLRRLLAQAETQLTTWGLGTAKIATLLAPVQALAKDDLTFWQEQSAGLAVFLAPGFWQTFRLPIPFAEKVVVGQRFYLRPLLPLLAGDGQFYLLALSQHQVRLFQGERFALRAVALHNTPLSLAEATQYDQVEPTRQMHSIASAGTGGGRRAVAFHGQGTSGDATTVKDSLHHFLQAVDRGVCAQLANENAPLLLAGTRALCGIYRTVNRYPHLWPESLDGNPDHSSLDTLQQRGWDLVDPLFQRPATQALARLQHGVGTQDARAVCDLPTVVAAAVNQRVETLFVEPVGETWGVFTPTDNAVVLEPQQRPGNEELLNLAVVHTLRNGGQVYVVEIHKLPKEARVAALLRY